MRRASAPAPAAGRALRLAVLAGALASAAARTQLHALVHSSLLKPADSERARPWGARAPVPRRDWRRSVWHGITNATSTVHRTMGALRTYAKEKITFTENMQPHVVVFMVGLPAVSLATEQ